MAVDGWAVTFGTARRGLGGASVAITVLLYELYYLCHYRL